MGEKSRKANARPQRTGSVQAGPGSLESFVLEFQVLVTIQGNCSSSQGWGGLAGRRPTAPLAEEIMKLTAMYQASLNGRPRIPN